MIKIFIYQFSPSLSLVPNICGAPGGYCRLNALYQKVINITNHIPGVNLFSASQRQGPILALDGNKAQFRPQLI
jgi:hypothetical protein